MAQYIQHLMDQFGYYVLAISLLLELLALPLPGEVLMTYTGLQVYHGNLNWGISILTAGLGASIGMTISYWIGYKLGTPFFEKYGSKVHLGPERLKKTSEWFERYGNKLLIVAYFIPGIRHITGYFSGLTRIPLRTYMIYAYVGAFLWTGTFISIGKILGPKWEQFQPIITRYLIIAGIIAAVILALYYVYRTYRNQIYEFIMDSLNSGVKTFHSLGKVKFLILISIAVFLSLFVLMIGLIQDLLANEFANFDLAVSYLVHAMFDENGATMWMSRFALLASLPVMIIVVGLTILWIVFKGKDRLLEAEFLGVVIIGGELYNEALRRLFHRIGPDHLLNSFPSDQTLMTITLFGFAGYLFARHIRRTWARTTSSLFVLSVSFLVGLSQIYFQHHFPSDVVAGYVFGGVWLSLNIISLEIFRLTKNNRHHFFT